MTYYCDDQRHLVCVPYSIENLHEMARNLEIKRCWYHASAKYKHYDIPVRRISEITSKCVVVSAKQIVEICKGKFRE